jgi:hypothetical protein
MPNDLNALSIYLNSIRESVAAEEVRQAAAEIEQLKKTSMSLFDSYALNILQSLLNTHQVNCYLDDPERERAILSKAFKLTEMALGIRNEYV